MISQRFLILLSFLILLVSPITFSLDCSEVTNITLSNSAEENLVFLKGPSAKLDHFNFLKHLGRRLEKFNPGQNIFNGKADKNAIIDFSVDGQFAFYSGFFEQKFVDNCLKKRNEVDFV